jgi:hypothetical protein
LRLFRAAVGRYSQANRVNRNVSWVCWWCVYKQLSSAVNTLAETDIKLTVNRNGPLDNKISAGVGRSFFEQCPWPPPLPKELAVAVTSYPYPKSDQR